MFARIAAELARRRPDIPLLVVEGRGTAGWLKRSELPLSGNAFTMANTPDPRDFYRVSRLVLMPPLWQEAFGRVAAEALMNGIPVLASNRGALPEVLDQAGFLFDIPPCYTPESQQLPSADEVAPWWDDETFYRAESLRCRAAAEVWRPEQLLPRFEQFFQQLVR